MALTIVQHILGKSVSSTTASVVFSSAPTNGNLLIAFVYKAPGSAGVNTITGTGWTVIDGPTAGLSPANTQVTSFSKVAGASESTTQTPATFLSARKYGTEIYEVSGQATAGFIDAHKLNTGAASGGTVTTTSVTPSTLSELMLFGVTDFAAAAPGTALAGDAALTNDDSDTTTSGVSGWHRTALTTDTTTALSYTFTDTTTTLNTMVVLIKPAPATASVNASAQAKLLHII